MAVNFTPSQQKVIDLHGRNILVCAAAGSGKTAVLVERIIKMVTDETERVDIDRLLVVTFTKAAASEMRERISRAIDKGLRRSRKTAICRDRHRSFTTPRSQPLTASACSSSATILMISVWIRGFSGGRDEG